MADVSKHTQPLGAPLPMRAELDDAQRLAALRRTALLDTPTEEAFDRLTRLAAHVLRAPVALLSLVDTDRQFLKSCVGMPEPWVTARETPLSHSICQHVVTSGEPLVIEDTREHPLVRENLAIPDINVIAYAGMPLVTPEGLVLGSFCVIDHTPRRWTPDELAILRDLSISVMTEIELRAMLQDTEHRLAEQHQLLFETSPLGISYFDAEGRVLAANPAASVFIGLNPSTVVGFETETPFRRVIAEDGSPLPPDRLPSAIALRTGKPVTGVVVGLCDARDGVFRWLSTNAVPQFHPGEDKPSQIFVTCEDVTERKRLEEERIALLTREQEALAHAEALRESDRLKTALLGSVSHELRTPLTAIKGAAGNLLQLSEGSAEGWRDLVTVIDQSAKRLGQLITNLLDLSRLEAGAAHPELAPEFLDEVIGAAISELRQAGEIRSREIRIEAPAEVPLVALDHRQMRRVLINLIENALKFSPPESPVLVRVATTRREVIVSVIDAGIGIAPEYVATIFDKFARVPGVHLPWLREATPPGTGLGLAICRDILRAHNGRIWVESTPGHGTTMRFALPRAVSSPAHPEG